MQTMTQCCCPLQKLAAGCWLLGFVPDAGGRGLLHGGVCGGEHAAARLLQVLDQGMPVFCSHFGVHPPGSSLSSACMNLLVDNVR